MDYYQNNFKKGILFKDNYSYDNRKLLLILVAYHPPISHVKNLQNCLASLNPEIGYALVVNDYKKGEPVLNLIDKADYFLLNKDNPGYGIGLNRLFKKLSKIPQYVGALNLDLSWDPGTFETLLHWLNNNPQVVLASPSIVDQYGNLQKLCKRNPTILSLFSRRFLPKVIKPDWLLRYDSYQTMEDFDYSTVFEVPYLSGCCMILKSQNFINIGGFDERYFLYLEDADLTRKMSNEGKCIHLPIAKVTHGWGRGNHRSSYLTLINLLSACIYFYKWGFALW